jgi:hypothetical protein
VRYRTDVYFAPLSAKIDQLRDVVEHFRGGIGLADVGLSESDEQTLDFLLERAQSSIDDVRDSLDSVLTAIHSRTERNLA